MIFRLDLDQISFNLVENVFTTRQLAFLATDWHCVLRHLDSGMHRNQNFEFLDEKVTYVFRLFDFWNFFIRLSIFTFSFFAALIDLLLGLLAVKKLLRKHHRDG